MGQMLMIYHHFKTKHIDSLILSEVGQRLVIYHHVKTSHILMILHQMLMIYHHFKTSHILVILHHQNMGQMLMICHQLKTSHKLMLKYIKKGQILMAYTTILRHATYDESVMMIYRNFRPATYVYSSAS